MTGSSHRGACLCMVIAAATIACGTAHVAAQPFAPRIAPFTVERSDGSAYINPFSGGLVQPRIGFRDVDGDGDRDLLTLNPDNRLRLYRNDGGRRFVRMAATPYDALTLRSWFRLADIDSDGRDELLTSGNLSELLFYHNVGTPSAPRYALPADTLRRGDTVIYTQQETVPSFVDIDGDGDLDLFTGNTDGSITFYRNIGTPGQPHFTFITANYMGILVISPGASRKRPAPVIARHGASVLDFADLDGDGDLDILFGDFFTTKLLIFTNTGTRTDAAFSMSHLDTAFRPLGDDVLSLGFNQPVSGDIDGDGDADVLISSLYPLSIEQPIILYENVAASGAPNPVMRRRTDDLTSELDFGTHSAPTPIDDNGHRGMLVGTSDGTITYLAESAAGGHTTWRIEAVYATLPGLFQAVPAAGDLDGDGIDEVVVGDANDGRVRLFRFQGNRLVAAAWPLDTFHVNSDAAPLLADFDNDGDLDLLVGAENGRFVYFENTGTPGAFRFESRTAPGPLAGLDIGANSMIAMADVDHDGQRDIAIAGRTRSDQRAGFIRFYLRRGATWERDAAFADIVADEAPAPSFRRLPEGLFLVSGTVAGGLVAYADTGSISGVLTPRRETGRMRLASTIVHRGDRTVGIDGNIPREDASIVLSDPVGRILYRTLLHAGDRFVMLPDLAPGVYFVGMPDGPLGKLLVLP